VTLVDTSSWIPFLRRGGDVSVKKRVRDLLNDGSAAICPVVLAELWMGAGSAKDRQDVQELQDVLPCLPMNQQTWDLSYRLAGVCCERGTPAPASDLLIAACAFSHGSKIDAEDKHFAKLETYRALVTK
jgi:predicted nucleic acid-binding protein